MDPTIEDIQTLDVTGLHCPLPIFRAKKAISLLSRGAYLQVLATDPDAIADFESYTQRYSHQLVHVKQEQDMIRILIKVN